MLRCALMSAAASLAAAAFTPQSARTFNVLHSGESTIITTQDPSDATSLKAYVLTPRNGAAASDAAVQTAVGTTSSTPIVRFTTPLNRVAVLTTTMLPWFEAMGVINTVKAVSSASTVESTCLRAALADGRALDITDMNTWGTNMTALNVANVEAVFCDASWGCPGTALDVPLRDFQELTAFAVAEYAGLLSYFFDSSAQAKAVAALEEMRTRYTCGKQAVADATALRPSTAAKPRLLWAYTYNGYWYTVSSCTTWYCPLVTDAGATLLFTNVSKPYASPSWGGLTLAEFAPLLAQADVWVYANDNFETEVRAAFDGATGADAALVAALRTSPAFSSGRVFDLLGRHINSWFEERPANPDAFLQDLVAVANPDTYSLLLAQGAPGRVWLRNVKTEAAVTTLQPVSASQASTCAAYGLPYATDASSVTVIRLSSQCAAYRLDSSGKPIKPTDNAALDKNTIVAAAVGGSIAVALVVGLVALGVKSLLAAKATAAVASTTAGTVAKTASDVADPVMVKVHNPIRAEQAAAEAV